MGVGAGAGAGVGVGVGVAMGAGDIFSDKTMCMILHVVVTGTLVLSLCTQKHTISIYDRYYSGIRVYSYSRLFHKSIQFQE